MPQDVQGVSAETTSVKSNTTLSTEQRKRLIALLTRVLRASEVEPDKRVPLENTGLEFAVRADGNSMTVQLYERRRDTPSLSFTLSRSVTCTDLAHLREGKGFGLLKEKTERRLERRERALQKVGNDILKTAALRCLLD
jgi:hypothetical protein